MRHFFNLFVSSCALRLICDTDWTHMESETNTCLPVCVQYFSIWWSTFLFFHILYIKIHAQVLYNTIPSNSFMYLFNHGWHGFGYWLSLPLIGAIGIKIKILYGFCEHSTVTISTMLCLYLWIKKNYGYLRVTECLFADIEQLGYHLLKSVVLLQKLFQIHWKPTDHIHASKKETCIVCMVYLLLSVSLIVCVKENALIVEI